MRLRRSYEEVEKDVNDLGYDLLDYYIIGKNRRVVIQNREGYKWDGLFGNLTRPNRGINFFDKGNIFTLENISRWLQENEKTFELCSENEYMNNSKKLLFHCLVEECREEFDISWGSVSQGRGCPFCSGRRVSDRNRLSLRCSDIALDWDYNLNEDTPHDVSYGSNESRWWICPKGKHDSYISTIKGRTSGATGCLSCSGRIVSDDNRLSITHPKIASEWDHDKNEDTPDDVSYGVDKTRWWICPKGHSYPATIHNRTGNVKTGCPICRSYKAENKIEKWLENKGINYIPQKRFPDCMDKRELPFDFGIPYDDGTWFLIEYHGEQHYEILRNEYMGDKEYLKERQKRDKIKKKYCKNNNIPLLIIPYWDFDNIEQILERTFFE